MKSNKDNPNTVYDIKDSNVKVVKEEKDLGIIVNQDLKVANQCAVAVKAANRTLGLIKRTFTSRKKDIIVRLYKSLIRPHLEYCMSVWRRIIGRILEFWSECREGHRN